MTVTKSTAKKGHGAAVRLTAQAARVLAHRHSPAATGLALRVGDLLEPIETPMADASRAWAERAAYSLITWEV